MPQATNSPASRWERIRRRVGRSLSEKLYQDISRFKIEAKAVRRPPMSVSLAVAYAVAGLIYATSAAFAVLGVYMLSRPKLSALTILGGLLLLALAWFARPKRGPPPSRLLSRGEAPNLYNMADRLADAMGAPKVEGIGLSKDFNANYRISGFPGKRYMELGLALFAILGPQERVALMAHELSHGANGDPLRGQFLYGAFATLVRWGISIRPLSIGDSADGTGLRGGPLISLVLIPFEIVQLLFSELLLLIAHGFLLLIFRESQRAEYLADLLAAHTAGAANLCAMLEKTYLYDSVEVVIRRHTLTSAEDRLLPKMAEAITSLPDSALEKLRAESLESLWQADATHPPTAYRVAMLAARPELSPRFSLTEQESAALDAEIARLAPPFERQLVNEYLETISG